MRHAGRLADLAEAVASRGGRLHGGVEPSAGLLGRGGAGSDPGQRSRLVGRATAAGLQEEVGQPGERLRARRAFVEGFEHEGAERDDGAEAGQIGRLERRVDECRGDAVLGGPLDGGQVRLEPSSQRRRHLRVPASDDDDIEQ